MKKGILSIALMLASVSMSAQSYSRYDVNHDGNVTIEDVAILVNHLNGKVNFPIQSISLSSTSLKLKVNDNSTLTATVLPSDADNLSVTWSSSNTDVAFVNSSGKVMGVGVGTATITATASDGSGVKATCMVTVTAASPSPEYVEIGGLKWATMNLGATTVAGSPSTCYGDYYAWGETEPRYTSITISGANSVSFGGWSSSHSSGYYESDYPTYTKYTLDAAHDAATQNWGSEWRTPTSADFQALAKACTGSSYYSQTPSTLSSSSPTGGIYWLSSDQTYLSEYKGVAGILFVDQTDTSKRVFFPAAGYCGGPSFYLGGSYGYYWSSSLYTSYTNYAYNLYFNSSDVNPSRNSYRYIGFPVRPISK